ncbi:hypothetical protein K439DRAFT_214090 [Ramaria rubella]|nr:hypothetical protein K439DRAFT_214090 [Ramaria rubella]
MLAQNTHITNTTSNGQCNGDNQLVDMDRNNPLFLQHIGIFEVPNTSNGNNQIVNSDQDPSNTQRATGNPSNSNQGPDGGLFPNDGLLPVSDNSGNSDGLFGGNTGTTFLGFPGSQDPNPGGGVRRLTAGLTASLLGGAFDPNGGSSFDHGDDRPVFPGQFPHGASDGLVDPTDEGGFPDGTHPDGFGADSSLPGGLDNDPDNSQLGGLIDGGSESDTLPEGPEGSRSNPPDNSQIGGFDDLHPTISDGVYAHGPDGNPEGSTPDALHHDDSPADTDQHRHGAGNKHHLGNGSRLEGDSDDPRFGDIHSDQGSHRDHLFDGDHDGPRFNDWTAPHGRLNGLPFGPGHDHTLGDDSEDVPSDPDSSPHRPTHSPSEHPHAGANPSNRFGYFDPGPVRFHRRPHDIHVSPGNNGLPHSRITHDTKHYRFSYYFGYFFMSSYPSSAWAKRDRS